MHRNRARAAKQTRQPGQAEKTRKDLQQHLRQKIAHCSPEERMDSTRESWPLLEQHIVG